MAVTSPWKSTTLKAGKKTALASTKEQQQNEKNKWQENLGYADDKAPATAWESNPMFPNIMQHTIQGRDQGLGNISNILFKDIIPN